MRSRRDSRRETNYVYSWYAVLGNFGCYKNSKKGYERWWYYLNNDEEYENMRWKFLAWCMCVGG